MDESRKRRLQPHVLDLEDSDDRSDAKAIASILNDLRKMPECVGFDELVRNISLIDGLAAGAGYPNWPFKGALHKKTAPLFERIRPYFEKHRLVYTLGFPTRTGWRESIEGKVRDIPFAFVLRGATRGLLRLLVQCSRCMRWFVSRRKDHKFCSIACREKAFRCSDEGKAKRAAYMKRYREGLRRRDRESLRVSRGQIG
jgi:hypothetical protein